MSDTVPEVGIGWPAPLILLVGAGPTYAYTRGRIPILDIVVMLLRRGMMDGCLVGEQGDVLEKAFNDVTRLASQPPIQ